MRRKQSNCVVAHVDMSALPPKRQAQPPSAPPSSDDALGEVQDILAERTSTTLGCSEVLVVWKPTWIPITNVQDGPILRKFRAATKCYFLSAAGKLNLPVEPDTALADDIDAVAARAALPPHRFSTCAFVHLLLTMAKFTNCPPKKYMGRQMRW